MSLQEANEESDVAISCTHAAKQSRQSPAQKLFTLIFTCCWLLMIGCGNQDAREVEPLNPKAAMLLGQAQRAYGQGAYVMALGLADSVAHHAPGRVEVAFLQGLIHRELLRHDKAKAAFEQVLALDPAYRSARYNLGQNAFVLHAYREALRWYRGEERLLRETSRRSDDDQTALAVVLAQIGRAYALMGVADSARAAYREALEADATNASAHAWLAELDRDAGNYEAALEHAQKALDLEPGNPEYTLLLGVTLLRAGQAQEALAPLRAAVQQQPWNREAVYNLGRALVALGSMEEAAPHLARADTLEVLRGKISLAHLGITQYPDDPARWAEYAFLLNQIGHRAEARKAFDMARYLQARSEESEAPPAD